MFVKILKSLLALLFLLSSVFFFYVDGFIFRHVILPSWQQGTLAVSEQLEIFKLHFNNNLAYIPVVVYLACACAFAWFSFRLLWKTWS